MHRILSTQRPTKDFHAKLWRLSARCFKSPTGLQGKNSSPTKSKLLTSSYQKIVAGGFVVIGAAFAIYEYRTFPLPLDIHSFLPFVLQSKESVSSTCSIFTLIPDFAIADENDYCNVWDQGIWSVQVKQPLLQIARSYTPLPPTYTEKDKDGSKLKNLRFLIRREPQGEVSRYLHNLPLGASINLRGPHLEYAIPQDVDEVLFIAGGTGIATGLQAAYSLFEHHKISSSAPVMHILWANRKKEEVPDGVNDTVNISAHEHSLWKKLLSMLALPSKNKSLSEKCQTSLVVKELESMKARHKGKLLVDYFIDEEGSYITEEILRTCLTNLGNTRSEKLMETSSGRKLILISGPEGFVRHFAGPKSWVGGKEIQGSLGGILKRINPSQWEIWKL